jgi:hypothetical protein
LPLKTPARTESPDEAAGVDLSISSLGERQAAAAIGGAKEIRDIAWKAQVRLCGQFRRLAATRKKTPVIVAAIARERCSRFLRALP